jgi:hypothetical protein
VEDSGDGVTEEIEMMEKIELTQHQQEGCKHQEMILRILAGGFYVFSR